MTKASDYETSQHSRSEELAALDKAKSILQEKTGGAAARAYSFIQLQTESRVSARAEEVKDRVVALVQQLADKDGSKMLSLLAQRMESAVMMGADPFAKANNIFTVSAATGGADD